jgi:seipin
MITSAILLGLAITAYILFYFNYVPQIGIERIIHLQYGYFVPSLRIHLNTNFIPRSDGPHPYGIAPLDLTLVGDQPYDIALSLHVPRSPPNLATGNFMLSLSLLSPSYNPPVPSTVPRTTLQESHSSTITPSNVLFLSRRPAILTYTSRLVSLSSRILSLPLYILGLKHESEMLHIPMAESAIFKKGRANVPAYVLLELQTGQEVQVYDVRVQFKARFGGMRWLMYNHRIISFFTFTTTFWFAEILFAGLSWVTLRYVFTSSSKTKIEGSKGEDTNGTVKGEIKEEPDTDEPDLSDTPRTFPTYGRQQPLRYVPKVKDEDSEEYVLDETAIQPLASMEADDEEDEEDLFRARDSGIGTSFSEGGERGDSFARRRSGRGRGGGT